jgi:hypothetical protein
MCFIWTHKSMIMIEHNFLHYPNVFLKNIELNSASREDLVEARSFLVSCVE